MNIGCASCGQIDCTHSDPVYLGIVPIRSAVDASFLPVAAATSTGGAAPCPAGHFVEQRPRDRNANRLVGLVKRFPVHGARYAA
jgi:hypothetical protein